MLFFSEIYSILITNSVEKKLNRFALLYQNFRNNDLSFDNKDEIKVLSQPSYSEFCNIILPKNQKKRKYLDTIEGKKHLLHTIAHIEYSAIDLALDACYRFRDMPIEFYKDWLEVAEDEVRHFTMLRGLMDELGVKYGDFGVHTNLFEAMQKTPVLLERIDRKSVV